MGERAFSSASLSCAMTLLASQRAKPLIKVPTMMMVMSGATMAVLVDFRSRVRAKFTGEIARFAHSFDASL